MHSLPSVLVRQSLRSNLIHAAKWTWRRTTTTTTTLVVVAPAAPQTWRHDIPAAAAATRSFAICTRCRFRAQTTLYHPGPNEAKDGKASNEGSTTAEEIESKSDPGLDGNPAAVNGRDDHTTSSSSSSSSSRPEVYDGSHEQNQSQPTTENPGTHPSTTTTRRLPSNMENRRSQLSKQFTTLMDNLQSNVFVVGQRLNDLTGYSAIEALKREIQEQGTIR